MVNNEEVGIPSIRIGGKPLDELGMVDAAHAKMGLPAAIKTDLENKIAAVKAAYPKASIMYIDSRIKECRDNIIRVIALREEQKKMISEYTALISLCEHRDKQLLETDDEEAIKALKKQFPPYDTAAMRQQIIQSEASISSCDDVVETENASITEFSQNRVLCERRDKELKKLGACVE